MNGLDKTLEAASKVIDTVPEIYNDALQPLAKETGKTGGLIGRALNAALAPLEKWVLGKEYNVAETKKLLSYKLEHLDPQKIVEPEAYVAVPALQAISYCMDSTELRNMFANLLVNSMNQDIKSQVHPGYVEIIKQLSPLDAINLKYISEHNPAPIVNIIEIRNATLSITSNIYVNLFLNGLEINDVDLNAISISNLNRLGLIITDYSQQLSNYYKIPNDYDSEYINPYDKYINHPKFTSIHKTKPDISHFSCPEPSLERGQVFLSPLGVSFVNICMKDS